MSDPGILTDLFPIDQPGYFAKGTRQKVVR